MTLAIIWLFGGSPPPASGQVITAERIRLPGWWPTKGDYPRSDYVGPEICAPCHPSQADPARRNAMSRTGLPPSQSVVLQKFPDMRWQRGPYTYRIHRKGDLFSYSVGGDTQTVSAPLEWAVGLGGVGQTYLYR